MEHGPAWSQGIVVIDAALILASAPTEGVDHEMLEAPAKGKAPKTDSAQAPSSDARLEIEKLHRQLAEKALDATRAWQRYESSNRMCMSLQIERAKMVNQIHPAAPLLACAPRAAANGDNRGTALTCWCEACDLAQGELLGRTRMAICPNCGDKRCPRAIHHDAVCPASAARTPASDSQENPIG